MNTDKLIDENDKIRNMKTSEDLDDDSKRLLKDINVDEFSNQDYNKKVEALDLNKSEINRQQSEVEQFEKEKIIKDGIDVNVIKDFNDNVDTSVNDGVFNDASVSQFREQVEGTLNRIDGKKISDHEKVQNRLDECTMLELLYLKKHNELKTSVELNTYLYNEFSNAMNIIYYILKNLVISSQEKEDLPEQEYNEANPEPYVDKLDDILISNCRRRKE